MVSAKVLSTKILEASNSGNLLDFLCTQYTTSFSDKAQQCKIISQAAELHNCSKINLIKEYLSLTRKMKDFYSKRRLFYAVLPSLNSDPSEVFSIISHIESQLDSKEMIKSLYFEALIYFLNTEEKVTEALRLMLARENIDLAFLSATLLAGTKINSYSYINKTLEIINEYQTHDQLLQSIVAIGFFDFSNQNELLNYTTKNLSNLLQKPLEDVPINLLRAIISLYCKYPEIEKVTLEILKKISFQCTDLIIHSVADDIITPKLLSMPTSDIVNVLLGILLRVKKDSIETFERIDHLSYVFFEEGKSKIYIEFIEKLLLR